MFVHILYNYYCWYPLCFST